MFCIHFSQNKSYIKNKIRIILFVLSFLFMNTFGANAFSPGGKAFGFGLVLGEPTGLTGKLWLQKDRALNIVIGNSYFGNLRLGADYLWHFDAFNSNIANMYAGPGIAFGFGESSGWWYKDKNKVWYHKDDEFGFGARAVFGVNITPRRTPLEIFGEVGVMIGFTPATFANAEGAIGIRFYF